MVRDFLRLYPSTEQITIGEMVMLLKDCGWEDPYPRTWPHMFNKDPLTKAAVQIWLRWMFSLEVGKEAGYIMKTGHGTRFSEQPVNSIIGWERVYTRPGVLDEK